MKKRNKYRFIWLIIALAGLGFLLTGFFVTLAAVHSSVRISNHYAMLVASGANFAPTAEQYKELCLSARAISRYFGNYAALQFFFVLPVTIVSLITFVLQNKKPKEEDLAQPSLGALPHDPAGRSDAQG